MNTQLRRLIFIPVVAAFLFSCSGQKADKGEEVAEVNGSPIYMKELMKEVNTASRREPGMKLTEERVEEILHTMIDKKLLIGEAVKMGLSEDERFLESIKSFWEQTLIRELVETKNREWAEKLFVTDEEVKERHRLMEKKVFVKFIETHERNAAEAALSKLSGEGKLAGPLFIEDMGPSDPFFSAFGMEAGARAISAHDDDFYSFEVVKKEPSGALPLDDVYEALKASLLEEKKERALEEWLETKKKAAAIKVDETVIERFK